MTPISHVSRATYLYPDITEPKLCACVRYANTWTGDLSGNNKNIKNNIEIRAANDPSVFTITEKAPARAFSWLK